MQRDFTAVAFLRQISIITKLLFFSLLSRKTQTDRTTVACDILYILFLFASFWLRRPPLAVDERLWFLSCFSHEWLKEAAAAAVVAFFNCVVLLRLKWSHTNTLVSVTSILLPLLRFAFDYYFQNSSAQLEPIYDSRNFNFEQTIRISLGLERLSARRSWCRNG